MHKKSLLIFTCGLILILICGGVIGAAAWEYAWQDRILPGVKLEGVNVSGFSEQAAVEKIAQFEKAFLSTPVSLVMDERKWQVSRRDLGFRLQPGDAARRAFLVGRTGPLKQRLRERWQAYRSGLVLPLGVAVDRDRAQTALNAYVKEMVSPPVDAGLSVNSRDEVTITPGKPGKVLDLQATLEMLGRLDRPLDSEIPLRIVQVQPKVQTEDVAAMKISGLLGAYTTYFDVRNVNRTYNINVAADALDNKLIKPGEVFSFNRVVGPRSKETGYREALIIVQDQFAPGIGGGVCQVSSTLYNAVLLAGLSITERSNHSLPITYVPFGRDATVSYGWQDLKFRNNTDGYLYLRTGIKGGGLTVKIFGNTAEKKNITLESVVEQVIEPKVIKKEDPNLYEGKTVEERKGVKGYRVRLYSTAADASGSKTRKLVSTDYYKPVDQIIRVGTKPSPKPPVPPGPDPGPEPEPQPEPEPPAPELESDSAAEAPHEQPF